MLFKKKKSAASPGASVAPAAPVPRHIAIIMDGNGRWATKRGLSRSAGHAAGAENFEKISEACGELGVGYVTAFAFSTENWKRPEGEVAALMDLLARYLSGMEEKIRKNNLKMRVIGDLDPLRDDLKQSISRMHDISKDNTGIQINICLNYGGRGDIARAARGLAEKAAAGELDPAEIDEEVFASQLYTTGLPDPDLLIKAGAEKRISNFLLWQLAYSELYFTDTLWPDFRRAELEKAIAWFGSRKRRFGGV